MPHQMQTFEDIGRASDAGHRVYTMHEVGEAIRRAGMARKLTPVSEVPVECIGYEGERKRKIDWVWFRGEEPVIAFEIEGVNAPTESICWDIRKLTSPTIQGCIPFIVLYSGRFRGFKHHILNPDKYDVITSRVEPHNIKVIKDSNLDQLFTI